jgi:hypothetical protein
MTRMSKQGERRAVSRRKRKKPTPKTGPRKENLPRGFKEHENALSGRNDAFIPKIK